MTKEKERVVVSRVLGDSYEVSIGHYKTGRIYGLAKFDGEKWELSPNLRDHQRLREIMTHLREMKKFENE